MSTFTTTDTGDTMQFADTPDPRQRTGRTTRMLDEARRLRDAGHAVYIVVHSMQYARQLQDGDNLEGVKFETLDTLRTLRLEDGRLMGAHRNCVVLMDHHAAEAHFGWVLRQASRFDLPEHRSVSTTAPEWLAAIVEARGLRSENLRLRQELAQTMERLAALGDSDAR